MQQLSPATGTRRSTAYACPCPRPPVLPTPHPLFRVFLPALCRGRRTAGLAYVVTYSLSCCTKHSPNFWVLMFGRVLGGIATSLLYSAFESWLVAEHFKHGFSGGAG